MPERRRARFLVEVLFLAALATALALARLDATEIAGLMLLGWVVVAALEWAAWRGEPHWAGGLPPRYHVPSVALPPPQPLEQVERGYPGGSRDEAPTWIASAALRAEVLGDWPVLAPLGPVTDDDADEDEEPEPEFAGAGERDADPWTVAALPAAPAGEVEPDHVHRAAPGAATGLRAAAVTGGRTARYSFDPLAEPAPRRRFGRHVEEQEPSLEVPVRPYGPRHVPGALSQA